MALRADDLMLVPRLTNETGELRLGLRVAHGDIPPLVSTKPYIGGLFTLVVAGAFHILGPNIEAGRLIVAVAGALTIVPTYLLGRDIGATSDGGLWRRRLVGMLAALLLALSGPHIITTSRIAYSNSLTPLFTTIALWLLFRAVTYRSSRALLASGIAFGLAIQTHIAALALVPGLVAALLATGCLRGGRRRVKGCRWPGHRSLILTVSATALMTTNLLVYSVVHRLAIVDAATRRVGQVAGDHPWTLIAWVDRLVALMRAVILAFAAQVSGTHWPLERLVSPGVAVPALLAILGLCAFSRRGVWLPLLVTLSVIFAVSLFNAHAEPLVPYVRHYASLLPVGAVLIAEGSVVLYSALRQRVAHDWFVWVGPIFLTTVILFLSLGSLNTLATYETDQLRRPDRSNFAYLQILDGVASSGSHDERVYLDDKLTDVRTFSGGRVLRHFEYAFLVVGQEYAVIDVERDSLPIGRGGTGSKRLLLAADDVDRAARRYRLEPLVGDPGEGGRIRAFRAFARAPLTEPRAASTPSSSDQPAGDGVVGRSEAAPLPCRLEAARGACYARGRE